MEKVKILILVLAGNTPLSNRNLEAQKLTWMSKPERNIKVLTYSGSESLDYDGKHLTVISNDDYSSLSYKALKSFEWIAKNIEFDYLFRTNTSSYIDTKKLSEFCNLNNDKFLYRGTKLKNNFNGEDVTYVSGAEILISKNVFNLLLDNKNYWDTSLVDDVSIGKVLQNLNINLQDSKSLMFDNSFFKLSTFNHEYHFRCRVDSPYYFPRFLEKYLIKYIHREINSKKILFHKRIIYFLLFNLSRIFAFRKHYDFLTYYLFKYAKILLKN